MLLKEVLSQHAGDQEGLIVALTKLRNDDEKLEPDSKGLSGLVQLLMKAGSPPSGSTSPEGLTLAGLLLQTAVLGTDLDGDHERVLLESNFVPALNKLLEGATTAIRGRATYPAALDAPLKALLDVLADVANLSSGKPQPSSGKVPRGREVHGTSVIQRLVPFMTLPLEEMHAVKHAASATLLEFLVSCRANCEQLGAMAHSAPLWTSLLPGCGDVATQIDLMEALYRCAKLAALRPEHRAMLRADWAAQLDALAARPTKGMDLSSELRRLLVGYNRGLGAKATVFSLQAKSVLVNGIDGLAATGRWVDFGLRSVSVGLNIPEDGGEEEGGATGQAPELEIVDFPYADVTRVSSAGGQTSGDSKLTVALWAMPKPLQEMSEQFKGPGTLVMQFNRSDLAGLLTYAPKVAVAMKAAGVAISSDGALSGDGLEMSQHSRKCSTGLTVYDRQEGQARSSGRAPLQLTRSGHTPSLGNTQRAAGGKQQQQQQPDSRPKSILKRSSSPAPAGPGAAAVEATLQPPAEPQELEGEGEELAEAPAAEEEREQEHPTVSVPRMASGRYDRPTQAVQPKVEEEEEEAAAAAAAQPAAPGPGGSQRRGRPASQRPVATGQTGTSTHTAGAGVGALTEEAGEVNSPAANLPAAAAGPSRRAAKGRGGATQQASQKQPAGKRDAYDEGLDSEGEEAGGEEGEEADAEEAAVEEEQQAPVAGRRQKATGVTQQGQRGKVGVRPRPGNSKGSQPAGGGRRKMQAAGAKGGGGVTKARRGGAKAAAALAAEDPIDTQTQRVAGARRAGAESPAPSWMREDEAAAKGKAPLAAPSDSDSESELQHDHASKQELFAKQPTKQPAKQPAAAALAAALAKKGAAADTAAEAAEAGPAKAKGKAAAAPASSGAGAAKAVKKAAAAAADESEGSETEAEEEEEEEEAEEQPQRRQLPKKAAAPKPAALKPAAKKAAGAVAAGKAGPSKPVGGKKAGTAPGDGRRPSRAAAVTASAKLAEGPEAAEEEEEWESDSGSKQPAARRPAQRPAAAAEGRGKAAGKAAAAGRDSFEFRLPTGEGAKANRAKTGTKKASPAKALLSPLRRMQGGKQAGRKREREAEPQAPEELAPEAYELTAAAPVASEPLAAEPEVAPAEASGGGTAAAAAAAAAAVPESELQLAQEHLQQEEAVAMADVEEMEGEQQEEEQGDEESDKEEEEAPAGGYRSEGTCHLAGWTNFRAPEADVPDMLVPNDELAGITRKFKFTGVKGAPSTGAAGGAAGTAGRRSKVERKAAAAGAVKKAPTLLLGLSDAKPAVKSARLTTTLSQDGLPGLAAPGAAPVPRPTAAAGKGRQQQQLRQPGAAAGSSRPGGKRALVALGQPSAAAPKRQKAVGGAAAKLAPAGAAGGRWGREAPAAVAAALDESQALSIHHLLQSAQRRAAEASQPTQADDDSDSDGEGEMDLAALQAMMLELVRKRKQAAQRKQAGMIAELEAEVAAAVAAKEKELAAAQHSLDSAVGQRFAALERQLDAKMREIDSAALAFQMRLNELWEEYRTVYDQISAAATEAEAAASRQRTEAARPLEQLREGLAARAVDMSRRIERTNKRAGKVPELAQMLAPFLG